MKIPVSLIVDDPAPIISVYYDHVGRRTTAYGAPIIPTFPNDFLDQFCDIVEKHGIKGKFTVIPMPGNKGDIVNGLEGVNREDLDEWLNTVKTRLLPNFTVGPEMLTHHKAVDLATGGAFEMNEQQWAAMQDRTALTPYIAKALDMPLEINILGLRRGRCYPDERFWPLVKALGCRAVLGCDAHAPEDVADPGQVQLALDYAARFGIVPEQDMALRRPGEGAS